MVDLFLGVDGISIDHEDDEGDTALLRAADADHVGIVAQLLAAGADPNHTNASYESALIRACRNGNVDMVAMLLPLCIGVDYRTRQGWAPLQFASQVGSAAIVEMLVVEGHADLDLKSNLRETALYIAAENGHLDVVRLLLAHGADASYTTIWERSPLNAACANNHMHIVDLLLASDVPLGSALLHAAEHGRVDVARQLLASGADVNQVNRDGRSSLMLAIAHGRVRVVQVLLAAGANTAIMDREGLTAVHLAREVGDVRTKAELRKLFHALKRSSG